MSNNEQLNARIRNEDHLIREHFSTVKSADRAYEIRRLLEKAIKIEQEEKLALERLKEQSKQWSGFESNTEE